MPLTKIQSLGITDGTIVNADINASAAIVSTKLSGVQGKFESQLLHVRDERSANTGYGTIASGSFQTRTLNTVVTNEITGASLSSNQITLPSGTYYIHASYGGYKTERHKSKLRNITDSSDTIIGTNEFTNTGIDAQTRTFVIGRFTIAAQKTFELQHRINSSAGGGQDGGVESNHGVTEVYADVQIWKVA